MELYSIRILTYIHIYKVQMTLKVGDTRALQFEGKTPIE